MHKTTIQELTVSIAFIPTPTAIVQLVMHILRFLFLLAYVQLYICWSTRVARCLTRVTRWLTRVARWLTRVAKLWTVKFRI